MTKDDDDALRRALDHVARRLYDGDPPSIHFDRQGRPITMGEWGVLFSDKSYQVLVQTWTRSGAWVSTVWLGIDHGWGEGAPIIFETMVWHDGNDTTQNRYPTEAAALAGHEAIVARHGGRDPNPPLDTPTRPTPTLDDDERGALESLFDVDDDEEES